MNEKIAIIGAGITGLSLAYFLKKQNKNFTLFEKNNRVGGNIRSEKVGNYTLEFGPHSINAEPELINFFKEFIPENEFLFANEDAKTRLVLKKGKYQKLPTGPLKLITSGFFSFKTKRKIFGETKNKFMPNEKTTLTEFFTERFGKEIVDYAVYPFVSGIYAGNPDKLLLKSAFPAIFDWMKKHGSILKAMKTEMKARPKKEIISFKNGLQAMIDGLENSVKDKIKLNQDIQKIWQENEKWNIQINDKIEIFDKIVLSVPAFKIADLIQNFDIDLSKNLRKIHYPRVVLAQTAYKKSSISKSTNAFGVLNGKNEAAFPLGTIFVSSTFNQKAPENKVLFSTFIGGNQFPEKATKSDAEILDLVHSELSKHLGISEKPTFQNISRYEKAIPQYTEEALEAQKTANKHENSGLFLAGNWIGGISLTDCIANAKKLSEKA